MTCPNKNDTIDEPLKKICFKTADRDQHAYTKGCFNWIFEILEIIKYLKYSIYYKAGLWSFTFVDNEKGVGASNDTWSNIGKNNLTEIIAKNSSH